MLKYMLSVMCLLFFSSANTQHRITIQVDQYESDTLIIGYHILDRQLVLDTLVADEPGSFEYRSEENLPGGMYLLLFHPDSRYVQFLVNDYEKDFHITVDYKDMLNMDFEGSVDNIMFKDYMSFLAEKRPRADSLREMIAGLEEEQLDAGPLRDALSAIDKEVTQRQAAILNDHPSATSALIIRANMPVPSRDFSDAEDSAMAQYRYFKDHYFDNLDMDNPAMLRTPVLFQRVDYYLNKLTPNHPDSIIESIDHVLDLMEGADETFKYYLSHFLNEYAGSRIVGYDAIYVHLVDNYYSKGKAPWVNEENLAKIEEAAERLRPVLIGQTGENITVYDEMNNPISIDDIDYEYLVLLFWSPDCSHCKKMMPHFVDFDKRWRDHGVRTFAICTKHREKVADCWEYVKEKDMLGFINAADEYHRSRFKIKYNVQTTPKVFVLDKDRKILMKNVGGDQLDQVMEEILKLDPEHEKLNK